jgi:hypothetical protein
MYGKVSSMPVLEIKDSSLFKADFVNIRQLYNYSISAPSKKDNTVEFMTMIQSDLKKYFGYEISIEERMLPCWSLIATSSKVSELKSTKSKYYFSSPGSSLIIHNYPISFLLSKISKYQNSKQLPFFDNTDIDFNIDISIDAVLGDLSQIKSALNKYSLDLVKGVKRMKVIVIREPTYGKIK